MQSRLQTFSEPEPADEVKLADILAAALESKFRCDLGFSDLDQERDQQQIFSRIQEWTNNQLRVCIEAGTIQEQQVTYDQESNTYPFATMFGLFLCGYHKIGL